MANRARCLTTHTSLERVLPAGACKMGVEHDGMYLEYVYTQELTLSVDLVRAIPKLSKVVLVCTVLITAIAIGVRRRFGAGFVERRVGQTCLCFN